MCAGAASKHKLRVHSAARSVRSTGRQSGSCPIDPPTFLFSKPHAVLSRPVILLISNPAKAPPPSHAPRAANSLDLEKSPLSHRPFGAVWWPFNSASGNQAQGQPHQKAGVRGRLWPISKSRRTSSRTLGGGVSAINLFFACAAVLTAPTKRRGVQMRLCICMLRVTVPCKH